MNKKIENQDFLKLTDSLVIAMMHTKDQNIKKVLSNMADYAQKLHTDYEKYTREEWDKAEKDLHELYCLVLHSDDVDIQYKGDIKVYLDNLLLDTMPRVIESEKKEEKKKVVKVEREKSDQSKPKKVIKVEEISVTLYDIKEYIKSTSEVLDYDSLFDSFTNEEKKTFKVYSKLGWKWDYALEENDAIRNYLILMITTKRWLMGMTYEELSAYMEKRGYVNDEFSIANIKRAEKYDSDAQFRYYCEYDAAVENGRRLPDGSEYDMEHADRLYAMLTSTMKEINDMIKNKKSKIRVNS